MNELAKQKFEQWLLNDENSYYYMKMTFETENKFISSVLSNIAKYGSCTENQFNAVKKYFKRIDDLEELRVTSNHIGVVGSKSTNVKLKIIAVNQLESVRYSYNQSVNRFLVKMLDDCGNAIVWFTSNSFEPSEDFVLADFIVKSHDEYQGVKQTVVQRVKFKNN